MGFPYEIDYRSGRENVVVDALSRVSAAELLALAITAHSNLLDLIKQSYQLDPHL